MENKTYNIFTGQGWRGTEYADEYTGATKYGWTYQGALTWEEFVGEMKTPVKVNMTHAEFMRLEDKKQKRTKDVKGFFAGTLCEKNVTKTLKAGKTLVPKTNDTVLNRTMVTLDAEGGDDNGGPMDRDTADEMLMSASTVLECAGLAYPTAKCTEEDQRWRLVFPLDRPVSPDEYENLVDTLIEELDGRFDPRSRDRARMMYYPTQFTDRTADVTVFEGDPLRVSDHLKARPKKREAVKSAPRGEAIPFSGVISDGRFELPDVIEQGERDTTLFRYACSLQAQGVDDDVLWQLVSDANETRCNPPMSQKDVETKIRSAQKYEKGTSAEAIAAKAREDSGLPPVAAVEGSDSKHYDFIRESCEIQDGEPDEDGVIEPIPISFEQVTAKPVLDALSEIRDEVLREKAADLIAGAVPKMRTRAMKILSPIMVSAKKRDKREREQLLRAEKKAAQAAAQQKNNAKAIELSDGSILSYELGEFSVTNNGIEKFVDMQGYKSVCRQEAYVTKIVSDIETGVQSFTLEYLDEGAGRKPCALTRPRTIFADSRKIVSLADYGLAIDSRCSKLMVEYVSTLVQLNQYKIPRSMGVSRLGWIKDPRDNSGKTLTFAPYDSSFDYDGPDKNIKTFESIGKHGDRAEWMKVIKGIRDRSLEAKIVFAATLASAAIGPLNELIFFVQARGNTELGKSFTLAVAASFWGNPFGDGDLVYTFDGTRVGIERTAGFMHSLPLFLDESQTKDMYGKADGHDKMIYDYCEGKGRMRGAKEGGTDELNRWKNIVISSGEHPITTENSGGGALNRVIDIKFEKPLYDDIDEIKDVLSQSNGFGGFEFVELLKRPSVLSGLRRYIRQFTRFFKSEGITGKQSRAGAILVACDRLASKFIYDDPDSALTLDEMKLYLHKLSELDLGKRSYDTLISWVTENQNYFIMPRSCQGGDRDGFESVPFEAKPMNGSYYGKITESGEIWIISSRASTVLDAARIEYKAAREEMRREGLLRLDRNGKDLTHQRIGETAPLVIKLVPKSATTDAVSEEDLKEKRRQLKQELEEVDRELDIVSF